MTAFPQTQLVSFIIDRILARLLITRGGKMVLKAKENDIESITSLEPGTGKTMGVPALSLAR